MRANDPGSSQLLSAHLNRQSRLLLRNIDKLRDGRPVTPQKLRRGLKRVELLPRDGLTEVAVAIARVLSLDQSRARREAVRILNEHQVRHSLQGLSSEKRKRFMTLNQLDASLWELAQQK